MIEVFYLIREIERIHTIDSVTLVVLFMTARICVATKAIRI